MKTLTAVSISTNPSTCKSLMSCSLCPPTMVSFNTTTILIPPFSSPLLISYLFSRDPSLNPHQELYVSHKLPMMFKGFVQQSHDFQGVVYHDRTLLTRWNHH